MRVICAQEEKHYRIKLILALILEIPILAMSMILVRVVPGFSTAANNFNGLPAFIWIIALFSTIIQLGMGYPFYVSAYRSVTHKSANMDVLIVLGTTAAWGYGIILLFLG